MNFQMNSFQIFEVENKDQGCQHFGWMLAAGKFTFSTCTCALKLVLLGVASSTQYILWQTDECPCILPHRIIPINSVGMV